MATPIVQNGKVYTLGRLGHLFCLDARKGDVLWQRNLEKDYQVAFAPGTPSPLIEGDLLILFIGGKPGACVVALHKDTGKEVWKALDESLTFSSPIVISSGGKKQLIVWTQESVTSLDPAAGTTYWRQRLLTSSDYAVSTPVFHKDRLLIGGLMFQLDPDKPAATVLWPASKAPARRIFSHTSTALFRGDHLFSAKSSGELICVEASTGKQVWESDQGDRPEKWGEHPPDSERRFRIALHGQRGADSCPAHFRRVTRRSAASPCWNQLSRSRGGTSPGLLRPMPTVTSLPATAKN